MTCSLSVIMTSTWPRLHADRGVAVELDRRAAPLAREHARSRSRSRSSHRPCPSAISLRHGSHSDTDHTLCKRLCYCRGSRRDHSIGWHPSSTGSGTWERDHPSRITQPRAPTDAASHTDQSLYTPPTATKPTAISNSIRGRGVVPGMHTCQRAATEMVAKAYCDTCMRQACVAAKENAARLATMVADTHTQNTTSTGLGLGSDGKQESSDENLEKHGSTEYSSKMLHQSWH